jgi:hypothetical protein
MSELFVPKGYQVFDKATGNLVATATRDIYQGDVLTAEQWILPDGTHPKPGDRFPAAMEDLRLNGPNH